MLVVNLLFCSLTLFSHGFPPFLFCIIAVRCSLFTLKHHAYVYAWTFLYVLAIGLRKWRPKESFSFSSYPPGDARLSVSMKGICVRLKTAFNISCQKKDVKLSLGARGDACFLFAFPFLSMYNGTESTGSDSRFLCKLNFRFLASLLAA